MTLWKACKRCGLTKPLEEFYTSEKNRDGRRSKCKMCVKAQVRANYRANKKYYQEYDRRRNSTPERKQASNVRHREIKPEKRLAYRKVLRAIASGELVRQPCEICGAEKVQAHHEDYSRPLDVIWLCSLHHHWIHS